MPRALVFGEQGGDGGGRAARLLAPAAGPAEEAGRRAQRRRAIRAGRGPEALRVAACVRRAERRPCVEGQAVGRADRAACLRGERRLVGLHRAWHAATQAERRERAGLQKTASVGALAWSRWTMYELLRARLVAPDLLELTRRSVGAVLCGNRGPEAGAVVVVDRSQAVCVDGRLTG